MRGEHLSGSDRMVRRLGSSPHARGTPLTNFPNASVHGIIPACAGNTPPKRNSIRRREDHPRMRGEHVRKRTSTPIMPGSSPHARGTPKDGVCGTFNIRIIPACAGNTLRRRLQVGDIRDHPRMRGEHEMITINTIDDLGSSPHARGTPDEPQAPERPNGIIPACAGNTCL